MGIQARLNMIVASIILTLFTTVAAVYIVQQPLKHMEKELATMTNLERSLLDFQATLNAFNSVSFRGHVSQWEVSRRSLESSFAELENISYLTRVSEDAAQAVENTIKLQNLLKLRMDKQEEGIPEVIELGNQLYSMSITFSLLNVYYDAVAFGGNETYDALFNTAQDFTRNMAILNQGIISSMASVAMHQRTIEEHIATIRSRTRIIGLAVVLVGIAFSLLISSLLSRSIVKNIRYFCNSTNQLAMGNLVENISVKSKGEFAILAKDMTQLQLQFRKSLGKIQDVSLRNISMKEELLALAEETSRTTEQIERNAQTIEDQMEELTGDIEHTQGATETIQNRVSKLNQSIHDQIALVEQSTASIQHMINSIQMVSHKTQDSREAAEGLVKTSQEGGDKLKITMDTISQVSEHIGEIRKMVTMINSIAAQTNLLAMNAAIESAHAGEAGRGFSVVADEIRKLAEAAGGNSKEIGDSLKRITKAIEQVEESGRVTMESFQVIDGFVGRVSQAFTDIDSNMHELSSGSTQILTSTKELTNITQTVKHGADEIQTNADKITTDVGKITQVSQGVTSSIGEIAQGIGNIGESVNDINGMSQNLDGLSRELNEEVTIFKTEEEQIDWTGAQENTSLEGESTEERDQSGNKHLEDPFLNDELQELPKEETPESGSEEMLSQNIDF